MAMTQSLAMISRHASSKSFSENGSAESEGFITFTPPASFAAAHGNDDYGTLPYSLGLLTTANPDIKPEKSRNYTFGTILQPFLGAEQGGGFQAGEHFAPRRTGRVEVPIGQPGDELAVRGGRRQSMARVAGEDFSQQDRHRPAVEHDVVVGQHKPVPVLGDADQDGAECRLVGEVADGRAFDGAEPLDLGLLESAVGTEIDETPGHYGIGQDNLDRLVELLAKLGREVRMPDDHRMHRVVQSVWVQGPGHREIELHRVHVDAVLRRADVEEQSLLQRGQRQDVGDAVLPCQLVDLVLTKTRRGDVGRRQPTAATPHVCADAGQRLEPQPVQVGDLSTVEN